MAENDNSRAVLKFNGGSALKVLKLKYGVGRAVDPTGRVASDPANALITITIEANEKSDILETLLNGKYKPTKGEVTFRKSHEEGTLITLQWENGYVIQHSVDFDAVDSNSMDITFTVSAETINYGSSTYNGIWPTV